MEEVILVDKEDKELGTMEKMEAHEKGLLHRAFSVFVLNSKEELLIHQRASSKYHSGGLWTNTCCSHPRKGESILQAAHRRLMEEMGMKCELKQLFSFIYKAELDKGLTEYELDHVLLGFSDDHPVLNPDEVDDWKYISLDELRKDISEEPSNYTEWFKIVLDQFIEEYKKA